MSKGRILIGVILFGCFTGRAMAQGNDLTPVRLTLKEALHSVSTENLQVLMANARLQQAIARIGQAQSSLLPHLEGEVSGGRQTVDLRSEGLTLPGISPHEGPFNNFDARPRVTMAIFDLSSLARFQAAQKGEKLSEAQLQKTREDVLALVADLFVDAQRKQQTVKLLHTLLEKDRMAYQLSRDNLNQGTGTLLDSSKYKSDLDQTRYLLAQAELQAESADMDLEAALQLPLGKPLALVDDDGFLHILEKSAEGHFKGGSNADVDMASSQLEASKADQKSAMADFLPRISGSADYGRSGASPQHGSNTYFVGVKATVPIWEGGANQAQLKEAKGRVSEARENLRDSLQQQEVNVRKARLEIKEADNLRRAKRQQRRTAQRGLLVALHAQQVGSGTVLAVMEAKAQLALAEDGYNEAQATWVMAHIGLLHAQGRLRDLIRQEK
ncbi:MAG: TolC family protein [Candidatus Omnitrophica bacterium]|nr:TolC family protein [Candidatus Omnitrophota bacterium]MDE2221516.1 TolC family protein [Candidatus Omnitrophota bacterium]